MAPPVVGGTVAALPSAVQDLTRFFLSLTGSSSQGAVGSVAGVAVPTSGASAPGVGAAASCAATAPSAGVERPPSASAAVPGSSGLQQREEDLSSRSRRRRRSSSSGTGRASKRRPRDRSPSPGRSARHQEESYRSSSLEEVSSSLRLEVLLVIHALLRWVTARPVLAPPAGGRGRPLWRSGIAQALVVICPPLLRVRRTMTALVPSTLWTSTGMTLSGPSWLSSGSFAAWKSQ